MEPEEGGFPTRTNLPCLPDHSLPCALATVNSPHSSEKLDIFIVSCLVCIVPFSQAAILYGQILFIISLSLQHHFPFKVLSTFPELTTSAVFPCLCRAGHVTGA